jgi:Family of unknown function (DUF6328)
MASEQISEQRLDRNWNELLQELRVAQTGVQILTGFLLTVPFSSRFDSLEQRQVVILVVVVSLATITTGLVIAPVAFHRILFRHRQRLWLVEAANICARAGLVALAFTSAGVMLLVVDVTLGRTAGLIALGLALIFFVVLWGAVPFLARRGSRQPPSDSDESDVGAGS